jgi:hypothetical protein
MQFTLGPILEDGGTDRVLALFISTPSRRQRRRSIEKFFREHTSTLTLTENVGEEIFWISVTLRDPEELGLTYYFVEALCAFLREHAFAVAGDRTQERPLRLSVRVSDDDEDAVDRSDPVIADATSRICRAFWENERFRAADFVYVDLPATPCRATVDLFLRGRSWNTTANGTPNVTIRVSDVADEPGNEHDLLVLELAGLRIVGEKSPHTAAVADVVLASTVTDVTARLRATMYSPEAAAAFAASLRRNSHHGFSNIMLVNPEPWESGVVNDTNPESRTFFLTHLAFSRRCCGAPP